MLCIICKVNGMECSHDVVEVLKPVRTSQTRGKLMRIVIVDVVEAHVGALNSSGSFGKQKCIAMSEEQG